jgi:radical SAM protein with 4Fe4S-binding SPASM domain
VINLRTKSPTILRREPFGGSLFDPRRATQLEFDDEGYFFLERYVAAQGRLRLSHGEQQFIDRIHEECDFDRRQVRVVKQPALEGYEPADRLTYTAPTIVDFQITTYCDQGCPHCYAQSTSQGAHVSFENISHIMHQLAEMGVFQIALGGGEPLCHPDIKSILKLGKSLGLVCNLTTSGAHLNFDRYLMLKKYCGAVALSLEGVSHKYEKRRAQAFERFEKSLATLLNLNIKTVLQVTVDSENLSDLDEITDFCLRYPALYGVIFLAYKPVGRGQVFRSPLSVLRPGLATASLERALIKLGQVMRVGYDCCMAPGLVGTVGDDIIEGCSALRSSIGITADLDVVPCTFLPDRSLGNLSRDKLADLFAMRAERRNFIHLSQKNVEQNPTCASCGSKTSCHGGCPVMPLVNCRSNYLNMPAQ